MSALICPLGPTVSRDSPSRMLPSTFPSIKRSALPVNSPRMRIPCVSIAASGEAEYAGGAVEGCDEDAEVTGDFPGGAYDGEANVPGAGAAGDGFPSGCFRHMETSSAVSSQDHLRTGYRQSLRFRDYSTEPPPCKPNGEPREFQYGNRCWVLQTAELPRRLVSGGALPRRRR